VKYDVGRHSITSLIHIEIMMHVDYQKRS